MGNRTPLHDLHVEAGARMVDFGGWDMPLAYGSQLAEHHAVRKSAGMFDVSHMTVVDLVGEAVVPYLRHLLANDVAKIAESNRALYTCMLNEEGGVIDDLIAYHLRPSQFRLVVNAATREKDLGWLIRQADGMDVDIRERPDLAMIAVQGPEARALASGILPAADRQRALDMTPFTAATFGQIFLARTGYTGEDGWEIIAPAERIIEVWQGLVAAGVERCGLGARDTLRLEAGLNLYGSDMDETTTPLESNLGWTVALDPADREFIGRKALERQRERGVERMLVGLVLDDKGVLRNGQPIMAGDERAGEITSGGYGPTLEKSIALARIGAQATGPLDVEIRGRRARVKLVSPPFVRHGKVRV